MKSLKNRFYEQRSRQIFDKLSPVVYKMGYNVSQTTYDKLYRQLRDIFFPIIEQIDKETKL